MALSNNSIKIIVSIKYEKEQEGQYEDKADFNDYNGPINWIVSMLITKKINQNKKSAKILPQPIPNITNNQ